MLTPTTVHADSAPAPGPPPTPRYGVLTILAFSMIFPMSLILETPGTVSTAWSAALTAGHTSTYLWQTIIASGAFYYL